MLKSVKIGDVVVTIAQVRREEDKARRLGKRVPGLYATARDLMGPDPERQPMAAKPAEQNRPNVVDGLSRFGGKGSRRHRDG